MSRGGCMNGAAGPPLCENTTSEYLPRPILSALLSLDPTGEEK
ncbi:hypothetical protein ACU8KH_03719 [Lachancea thermotolerans]